MALQKRVAVIRQINVTTGGVGKRRQRLIRAILIIEDDAKFAKILMDFVREQKFSALVAMDGESGIALGTHFLPSAIILDVTLPKIDGWGVMQSFKNNPHTRHIPVHFITGVENRKQQRSKYGAKRPKK